MSDNVLSLGLAKVQKENNSKNWQAIDALQKAIEALQSGELEDVDMVYVAFRSKKNGMMKLPFFHSGDGDISTTVGFLTQHIVNLTK
jgi:hypothetical protein